MSAPVAVAPTMPRPGVYMVVNLLLGASSPGSAGLRTAIVSQLATTPGNMTVNTEIRSVFSKEDVETASGRSPAYFCYQALYANDKNAQVDLICCPDSAGAAAVGTFMFAGTPTADMSFRVWIMGVAIDLAWNVGDAVTVARDNAVAAINQHGTDLMAIATAGTSGFVNIMARCKGPIGNDIRLRSSINAGAGGTLTASGANLTGGTTEVDFTTALSNLAIREYDYIVLCTSNTDAQAASSSNPARVATFIDANLTGSTGKLQQAVYASTGTISATKTGAIGRNHTNLEVYCSVNDESLPCECAGAEAGDRARRRRLESNANRVLQPLQRVRGSADPNGDQPTDTEATDALNNGVTLAGYTASQAPMLIRSVTTHSLDTTGNPDRRCYDTNEVDASYDVAKDLRAFLPQTYMSPDGQVKIAKNRQPGDDPNPAGVVEERDVQASTTTRIQGFWVPKGVIDGAAFAQSLVDGSFICAINESDPTQLDLFIPYKIVKILAKIGVYMAKVG